MITKVNLASLTIDWFEEHYPSKCELRKSSIHQFTMLAPKDQTGYYGQICDDQFVPWVFRGDDTWAFRAADPDFFTKLDIWFKTRILDETWFHNQFN